MRRTCRVNRWKAPLGRGVMLTLLGFCLGCPGLLHAAEEPAERYSQPVLIRFEGIIDEKLEFYVERRLRDAQKQGADLVIVEIESGGGFIYESVAIATSLSNVDWARTVAYVPQQALSGAAFVALGCDEIIMAPFAALGDAGGIQLGIDLHYRYAPEKIRTHLVRSARDLAEAKGRSPTLAEAMVDKDLVVFRVRNRQTGEEAFLSDSEIEADRVPGQDERWEKLNPIAETAKDRFFEVNGRRAVELRLAQGNAATREELAHRYGLAEKDLVVFEHTGVDTAVYLLNRGWITGLLFIIGLVALYIEFSAPGIGIGGLTAGLCFAIFFWSRFLGGTADLLEIILFLSGVAFLAVELFVLPGFGIAGLTGALLVLASLVLACQGFTIPQTEAEWAQTTGTLLVVLVSGLVFVVAAYLLSRHFGSLPILNRLVLIPPASDHRSGAEIVPGRGEGSTVGVGSRGMAVSPLRPAGKALFGTRYVDVVTDGDFIAKGSPVEILEVRGNRVLVGPAGGDA